MKLIKPLLTLILLLTLFFGLTSQTLAALTPKTVRVGTYNNPPKIYEENGKTLGVYADVLNYIAGKENWKLEYRHDLWEDNLANLEQGKIDIMVDVAVSEDRLKRFDFSSETVLSSWGVVYVKKDSTIDSILDLQNKTVSILKSSVYGAEKEGIEHYFKAFGINAVLIEVDDYSEVLNALDLGMADAAVVSHIYGLTHQQDFPNLKATNIFLKPTEIKFALTKGDPDNAYFIEKLDYWVKKLKADPDSPYHQSLKKYGLIESAPQATITPTTVSRVSTATSCWVLPAALGFASGFMFTGLLTLLLVLAVKGRYLPFRSKRANSEPASKKNSR